MGALPHIPLYRHGRTYESLDTIEVRDHRSGAPLATVSQANAGLVRRDLRDASSRSPVLRALSSDRLFEICHRAARLFTDGTLPLNDQGDTQSPDEYARALSATSGMPESMVRANMAKIATVLGDMPTILRGLTRGLDPAILDAGIGHQSGVPVSYAPTADALGVILPSNSPGVNSIWIPAFALKTQLILKPGREEPWTPLRVMRALLEAGAPGEAFGFYPTTHDGASAILDACGRSLLFGDARTTAPYENDPRVEIHGPGRSKVVIGEDVIDRFEDHLEVLIDSVAKNGGRSCINASAVFVPSRGDEVADALARRLATIEPAAFDDPDAALCAFANPAIADWIDGSIDKGIEAGGARDVTTTYRDGPRRVTRHNSTWLRPTVVRCESLGHSLANTEFLFPFTSVVEVPETAMVEAIGPSLVVTALTRNSALRDGLIRSPHVERLNLGPVPTSHVDWDQPHEGNLFEFLTARRAIASAEEW